MRLPVLLGATAALAVAVLIASFTTSSTLVSRVATSTIPGTLVALPNTPLSIFPLPTDALPLDNQTGATTSSAVVATSTSKPPVTHPTKQVIPTTTTTAAPSATAPKTASTTSGYIWNEQTPATSTPPAPDQAITQAGLDTAATNLRAALVNIICVSNGTLHSISGSGVVVDPKGIILTNAHIGQYFLLSDFPNPGSVACVIRTGSPAKSAYLAKLMYISSNWVETNASVLSEAQPVGNGQYDFAFLAITGSVTGEAVPTSFPYVALAIASPSVGAPVVIGSYAAQFLTSSEIQSELYQTVVFGSVKSVFTYAQNSVDVASFGGTAAAQEGSSGGGATDASGKLTATITTSTIEGDTSARELRGITATYIAREYAAETGSTLSTLFSQSLLSSVASFALQMPALTAVIVKALGQ